MALGRYLSVLSLAKEMSIHHAPLLPIVFHSRLKFSSKKITVLSDQVEIIKICVCDKKVLLCTIKSVIIVVHYCMADTIVAFPSLPDVLYSCGKCCPFRRQVQSAAIERLPELITSIIYWVPVVSNGLGQVGVGQAVVCCARTGTGCSAWHGLIQGKHCTEWDELTEPSSHSSCASEGIDQSNTPRATQLT